MKVVSVQVGKIRPSQAASIGETGIDKTPTDSIIITNESVEGDEIADLKNHGGPDQVVYIYSQTDYDFWLEEASRGFRPGDFGENITLDTMTGAQSQDESFSVRIGDRYRIGEVLLEVTAPRIPCGVFTEKVGEQDWVNRFRKAERPGAYCRVISPGAVSKGDAVNYVPADEANPYLREVYQWCYDRSRSAADLWRALEAPLSERLRASFKRRIERAAN